jgi:LmbE family N-acetylglucosaminyl deacetylase
MPLKLMAVLAHPDDESLGFGGVLAKCAAAGIETSLITATRGERGRFHGRPGDAAEHPGAPALGAIREQELRRAASALGIRDLSLLDYMDSELDRAPHAQVTAEIVSHLRRVQPDVVVTFGPEGAYGHPDHIAISQFTTAAVVAAADDRVTDRRGRPAHLVSKLYYLAWDDKAWAAYAEAFKVLVSHVDGVVRAATAWPSWAITTVVDTRAAWPTVWRAVSCHETQISAYEKLAHLTPEHHEALWGSQSFYRVFSLVNGGRRREVDLFEGISSGVNS